MKKCCAECIGDGHLRREIIPAKSDETGTCSYCESENVPLIEPQHLKEYFEILGGVYTPNDEGKTLVEWFKDDWAMFDETPKMDIAHAKELLADILDSGEIVRQLFTPSELCKASSLDNWEDFRNELKHENRFFPNINLNSERLSELLNFLVHSEQIQEKWYRARIQTEDKAFTQDKMGAPPEKNSSHGRANPAGIPYLYLASSLTTAISEIRPHTGEVVSVADFKISTDLKLIDLRHPRKTVSPFERLDENEIALLRSDIDFLEHLGEELTRPVLPQAAAIDYIPTQYVCEFIKKSGYHGVMYRSSIGDDINIALFYPENAEVGGVAVHKVSRVSVEVE